MFLGISIVGWILLSVVYVPISIAMATWARKRWREKRRDIVVVGVLLFAPFAAMVIEAAYVDWRFRQLCTEAKLTITRKVVVEGFFDDGYNTYGRGDSNRALGPYNFVEWRDGAGRIWRTERGEGEKSHTYQIDKPSARYYWRNQQFPTPIGHLLMQREETAIDRETGEVLGRRVDGYRRAPFIDALWLRFLDAPPVMCPSPGSLLTEVLVGIHDTRRN